MTSISDTEVVNAPGGLVELGYSQRTTPVSVTGAFGAQTDTGLSVTAVCDGSPVLVEFFSPSVNVGNTAGDQAIIEFWYDGSDYGYMAGNYVANANNSQSVCMYGTRRMTPTAGSHTFAIKAWRGTNTATINAGNGTSVDWGPTYLRVSKILQASQLLVTQSNAPIVTSLPSGNLITGQEVDLYVTTPYAGYQRHKWDGSAWYIIGDSRSVGAWQSWTPTITQGGNVAYTLSRARYVINGKTVQMMMGGTITGSGTSGNAISISLPTPAFTGVNFLTGRTGTFHYYRSATGFRYTGILELNTSTSAVMVSEETGGNALGASPSFSAGVNDQIAITATYEVS